MDDSPELTIGEVAHRAGVAASAIRYYESIGLLPVPLRVHGQRRYDAGVLGRLAFIGVAQGAGFSLDEIRELARGVEEEAALGEQMRALSAAKLAEVEALLERTRARQGWLEVASACRCESPEECALFPPPGEATGAELRVVVVPGEDCRRTPAGA